MGKEKVPATQAIRTLKRFRVDFTLHPYKYIEKGGTAAAARDLGIDEHMTVKTLVFENEKREPLLLLMHGDREVSTKTLARFLGVKTVQPCDPEKAHKHTGYQVGGISPFGTRKELKVYVESSVMRLSKIYINAGRRGLLAEISPAELTRVLDPVPVNVSLE